MKPLTEIILASPNYAGLGLDRCRRKIAYGSFATASTVAARMNKREKKTGVVEPYRCPDCKLWHIGGRA